MFSRNRRIVKNFCAPHSTEKLCAVLAFAQDGKMDFLNPCACLLGVFSSDVLHTSTLSRAHQDQWNHYGWAKDTMENAQEAERAYCFLFRWRDVYRSKAPQQARDRHFIEILNEILAERESGSSKIEFTQEELIHVC